MFLILIVVIGIGLFAIVLRIFDMLVINVSNSKKDPSLDPFFYSNGLSNKGNLILGRVDLSWLNFVRDKSVL
ncbi:hypothetical protein AB6D10_14265, partial [Vibrio splendidus]